MDYNKLPVNEEDFELYPAFHTRVPYMLKKSVSEPAESSFWKGGCRKIRRDSSTCLMKEDPFSWVLSMWSIELPRKSFRRHLVESTDVGLCENAS